MAGRIDHVERKPLNHQLFAVSEPHRNHVRLGLFTHHRDAMCLVSQRAETGYVIGVQMRVHRLARLRSSSRMSWI